MQFSTFEPSVRHSLVAISNLYEQIEGSPQPQRRLHLQDQSFALQHYNAAINELKAIQTRDKQPIVLIVCVLFICIEFLQSNREAASQKTLRTTGKSYCEGFSSRDTNAAGYG
ncbi:Aspercryptin biosynthesis cluster-specific transcription regulator atnN [Colletotrichum sp. SAR 10_77]|nr:Aspercryptin biosynthesis cluster-specific transcription regulator atnN [Colletotrichum sp. SAR 10_77]